MVSIHRALLCIVALFCASIEASKTPAVNFVRECTVVPYVLQFAMAGLAPNQSARQVSTLRDLASKSLFKNPNAFESDVKTVISSIEHVCGSVLTPSRRSLMTSAIRSGAYVTQMLHKYHINLTLVSDLYPSIAVEHLKAIVKLTNSISEAEKAKNYDQKCILFVRDCVRLLADCNLDDITKKSLAAIFLDTHPEFKPSVVDLTDKYELALEPNLSKRISFDVDEIVFPESLDTDELVTIFKKYFFKVFPKYKQNSSRLDWFGEYAKAQDVLAQQLLEHRDHKKSIKNYLHPITLGNTALCNTLKTVIHPDDSPIPVLEKSFLEFFDRLIERHRYLLFMGFKSVECVTGYPFGAMQRAKLLGIDYNALGNLMNCHLQLCKILKVIMTILRERKEFVDGSDRTRVDQLIQHAQAPLQIFNLFPNPTTTPTLKNSTISVGKGFKSNFWLPHAFLIYAKSVIKCPIKGAIYEISLRELWNEYLTGFESESIEDIPFSQEMIDKITILSHSFGVKPSDRVISFLNRYIKMFHFVVKENLSQHIPDSMLTIESFSDLVTANVEFVGILLGQGVKSKTLKVLEDSFLFFINVLSGEIKLSGDDEFVMRWGIFKIDQLVGVAAGEVGVAAGEEETTKLSRPNSSSGILTSKFISSSTYIPLFVPNYAPSYMPAYEDWSHPQLIGHELPVYGYDFEPVNPVYSYQEETLGHNPQTVYGHQRFIPLQPAIVPKNNMGHDGSSYNDASLQDYDDEDYDSAAYDGNSSATNHVDYNSYNHDEFYDDEYPEEYFEEYYPEEEDQESI